MMLDVKNITCSRGHRQLFNNLSFSVRIGQVFVVEGKNGSGKSTLLKILAGLRPPDIGEVVWHEQSTGSVTTKYSQQIVWLNHQNGIYACAYGLSVDMVMAVAFKVYYAILLIVMHKS